MVARWQPAATSLIVYGEDMEFFKSLLDFPRRQALLQALPRQIRTDDLTYAILERSADLGRAMCPPWLMAPAPSPI